MAKYLTDRQDRKLQEISRKVESLTKQRARIDRKLLSTGTDFGSVAVPKTTISGASFLGQDQYQMGSGEAWFYRVDLGTAQLTPLLDPKGNHIFHVVFNSTTQSWNPATSGKIDSGTQVLQICQDVNGNFEVAPFGTTQGGATTKLAKPQAAIPKYNRTTNTPGSGLVTVWQFQGPVLIPTAETLTAYNWTDYEIPFAATDTDNELILIHQEQYSNLWMVHADGQHTIQGFNPAQHGQQTLYPYGIMCIHGERDKDPNPGLGDNITVLVSADANPVQVNVDIESKGDTHAFSDTRSPTPGVINVTLGETIDVEGIVDEAGLPNTFVEARMLPSATPPTPRDKFQFAFGLLTTITDNQSPTPGSVKLFPNEEIKFAGAGGTSINVSKLGNVITVQVTGGGAGSFFFQIEDERSSPNTITVSDGEKIKFTTEIDKVGLPSTWTETRVDSGNPEQMKLAFGRFCVIRGWSVGVDGSENLFPTESIVFRGDYDQNPGQLGALADFSISKAGTDLIVDLDIRGVAFIVRDERSPQQTANLEIGNFINFASTVDETMTTKFSEARVSDAGSTVIIQYAFGKLLDIEDDQSSPNSEIIFPMEKLKFESDPSQKWTVTKAGNTVTAKIEQTGGGGAFAVGDIILNHRGAIQSGAKWYKDNGSGAADTAWALMDGTSNANPGSAIDAQNYFIRGKNSRAAATNQAFGRPVAVIPDNDEVTIGVIVGPHPDHIHHVNTDLCDTTDDTNENAFYFSQANNIPTSVQLQPNGAALTLDHDVTINLTNGQGSQGDRIEMLPPYKKINYFEKVA